MTNKPMLSVERELLERAASAIEKHHGSLQWVIASELRALLDKEVDGDSHAPKQQGEPVVWVECSPAWLKAGGDCATAPRICVGREGISHLHPAHSNTEQPAPVNCGALDPTQRLALCRGEKPAPVAVMRDALEQSQTDLQEGRTVSVEQLRDNLAAKFIGKKP